MTKRYRIHAEHQEAMCELVSNARAEYARALKADPIYGMGVHEDEFIAMRVIESPVMQDIIQTAQEEARHELIPLSEWIAA